MNSEVRKILDIFKNEPEVDSLCGKPFYRELNNDLVLDGHYSIRSLDRKIMEVIDNIVDENKITKEMVIRWITDDINRGGYLRDLIHRVG